MMSDFIYKLPRLGLVREQERPIFSEEFDSIYIFNLRGNQRTSGELSRKEGGKIFGSGSRTPISITLLVKNPNAKNEKAIIKYHDIGDYLSREDKLKIIKDFGSISNPEMKLKTLIPNEHGDWLNQRNDLFETFIPIEPEKKFDHNSMGFFNTYSLGIATARDAWVYNYSDSNLSDNMKRTIAFYNEQRIGYNELKKENINFEFKDFVSNDSTQISWNDSLRKKCINNTELKFDSIHKTQSLYRPFSRTSLYFERSFIQRPYQQPKLFPNNNLDNLLICVSGLGGNKRNSVIITNSIIDLNCLDAGTQCFPLYYYEERTKQTPGLFDQDGESEYIRHDGVSDFILGRAQKQYGKSVTKEDIFYYVYGILHSPDYRETFANDLKKMLPRIPLVDSPNDFWKFSKAGRALAELHINYESVAPYPDLEVTGAESKEFTVSKIKFPKKDQKDTVIYNGRIKIMNIPEKAYEYVVNGKSAIEWIMERYQVKTDKKSGIKNDPNDWSKEHNNPSYIFDLLLSIINVSVQTVDIVDGLPKLKFE